MKSSISAAAALLLTTQAWAADPAGEYNIGDYGEFHTGTQRKVLRCSGDGEIVGLRIKAGTYVDSLQLKCSTPNAAGQLGPVSDGPTAFGLSIAEVILPVSSIEKATFCPSQHVLSGFVGRGGEYLDRITSIRCTAYRGSATRSVTVNMGGTGGTQYSLNCRDSDRVTLLGVDIGQWIDQMDVYCASQPAPATIQSLSTSEQQSPPPTRILRRQPAAAPNSPANNPALERAIRRPR